MIKSTTKVFKQRVQQHILDSLSEDLTTDPKEQLEYTAKAFRHWHSYNQSRTRTTQEAFGYWLMCLPSEIAIEYSYWDMRNLLKEWYEQTDEESDKYTDAQVEKTFLTQIYMNFSRLCESFDVQP